MSKIGKSITTERRNWRIGGVTVNGCGTSFWNDGNALKLVVSSAQDLDYTQN
jgi:transcription elongation factor